ncbi:MAG: hypothetical protein R3F11_13220 [Verrucomicrobiales bacterium]
MTAATASLARRLPRLAHLWLRGSGRRTRLALLIAAALILHILAFYLFQVQYPPSERIIPRPARVALVSASNPEARPLLTSVEDQLAAFEPVPESTAGAVPDLGDYAARFEPMFEGYQPALRPFPGGDSFREPLDPIAEAAPRFADVLPPVDAQLQARIAAAQAERPVPAPAEALADLPKALPLGDLAGRTVESKPDIPEALRAEMPSGRATFYASADRSGAIRHALFTRCDSGSLTNALIAELGKSALHLKLSAEADREGPEETWGWLEIIW